MQRGRKSKCLFVSLLPMQNETAYDILLDYLDQRKNQNLNSKSIERRLKNLGKNEDQIHQIMIEFDDEWDRECMHHREVKNSKTFFVGGLLAAFCAGIISILSALGFGILPNFTLVWIGGVSAGLMLALKGASGIRKSKLRTNRLKIKYQNW